jgi:excisionase family DNA binding protein
MTSSRNQEIQISDKITVTVHHACALADIGRSSLYNLVSSGKLKTIKLGGRRLIDRVSLENLLRGRAE